MTSALVAPDPELAPADALAARVAALARSQLLPIATDIDVHGEYPEPFLRRLGGERFFGAAIGPERGGLGLGLHGSIRAMSEISLICGSTAFLAWCQAALVWYLEHTPNAKLRERLQRAAIGAEILGGTGLSNLMKSCAAIEELRLQAVRCEGGYVLNGVLPWVSNLGEGHWFAVGARVPGEGAPLMALVRAGAHGARLNGNARFVALEGTRTFACQFKGLFVPDAEVLAHPAEAGGFIDRIRPGFVLMQTGIALGLIEDCIAIVREANETHAHVNRYLDDQAGGLAAALSATRARIGALAERVSRGAPFAYREVLEARAAGAELALRASMAAMLHSGAKGYLLRNPAQRRVREAIFVAIVTPALKHIRKELAEAAA